MVLATLILGLGGCFLCYMLVKMIKASSYEETESDIADRIRECNNGQVYEEEEEGVTLPWD